jgi:L-aspartate oxidase
MSNYVGIVRTNYRLNLAFIRITNIRKEIEQFYKRTSVNRELLELRNMALISELVIRCALMRKESRGLHYNSDYPGLSRKPPVDTLFSNKDFK